MQAISLPTVWFALFALLFTLIGVSAVRWLFARPVRGKPNRREQDRYDLRNSAVVPPVSEQVGSMHAPFVRRVEPVADLARRPPARDLPFLYSTGDRPLDGYTIKRGIGRGGFGEVYYAMSDGGKEVALKLVQRHLDVELRGVTQCLNLKHPNLVTLYDVRQATNGDYWIVMEYVIGASLADVIVSHSSGMPHDQVMAWLGAIAAGVGHLHDHGIVHRDLKPGNIFIEHDTVKIGDYGLAKYISASRRSGQTESVGTVHYMAPEISRGRYGKEIDLYALGVILFEMLTGRLPFNGESPGEILMRHLTEQPDTSSLPEPYRHVVARLLVKDPADRYASVAAMLADLSGAGPPAPPIATVTPPQPVKLARTGSWHGESVHQPAARRTRRQSPAAVLGACLGFVGVIGLLVMIVVGARLSPTSDAGGFKSATVVHEEHGDHMSVSRSLEEWRRVTAHTSEVVGLVFHPTAERIAAIYRDGTLMIHELEKGQALLQLSGVNAAAFTPGGDGIIVSESADEGGSVRILDAVTGETKVRLEGSIGPLTRFAFAPGGKRVAALNDSRRLVRVWNIETGSQEGTYGKDLLEPAIAGIAFRDVRNLVAVDERLQAWLWDSLGGNAASGTAKSTLLESAQPGIDGGFTATSVVFGRGANAYAAGLDVGLVYYHTFQGLPTALITAHSGPVRSVATSDSLLASCGADGKIRIWLPGGFTEPIAPISANSQVTSMAITDDSRLLAIGNVDGSIVVTRVSSLLQPTLPATADINRVTSVAPAATRWAFVVWAFCGVFAVVACIRLISRRRPNRALYRAAKLGDISKVRLLLVDGLDVNERRGARRTALIAAAEAGHIAVVEHLLERGADPNARLWRGETALSLAATAGHIAVVEALVAADADVNSRASDGDTPLIEAAYAGHSAILRTLLEHGADTTARSGCDGSTPLIWAAYGGHTECVKVLLEHGANLNEKDTGDGSTPLIWAAYGNHTNVVRALLDHGADPNETNSSGETAFDHAESDSVIALLEAAVAGMDKATR